MPQPKSRLNIELTTDVKAKIEALQVQTQAGSITEVIRRAITLYDMVWERSLRGNKFYIQEPGGPITQLVFPEIEVKVRQELKEGE